MQSTNSIRNKELPLGQKQFSELKFENMKLRDELSRFNLNCNICNACSSHFDFKQLSCPYCGSTNINWKSYCIDELLEILNNPHQLSE